MDKNVIPLINLEIHRFIFMPLINLEIHLFIQVNDNEWLEASTKAHMLINLGNVTAVKKPPKDLRDKTSKLAAVEPPHPGSSYNPSLKDHNVRLPFSKLKFQDTTLCGLFFIKGPFCQ